MSNCTLLEAGKLIRHGEVDLTKQTKLIPINYIIDFIKNIFSDNSIDRYLPFMFLKASTGTGKTTDFPAYLKKHFGNIRIVVTEPRIVTVEGSAKYVSKVLFNEENVGDTVGYSTGISKVQPKDVNSNLLYMTHTTLYQMFLSDNSDAALPYDIIIIDEVHEMDQTQIMLLLKMIKDFIYDNHILNNNISARCLVIFQTATIDEINFCRWLCNDIMDLNPKYNFNNHIIEVKGKDLIVDCIRLSGNISNGLKSMLNILAKHVFPANLNCLAFVTDQNIINTIKQYILTSKQNYSCYSLSKIELDKNPDLISRINIGNKPYLIFTTSIAQTGITIPDLDIVINDNTIKQSIYLPVFNISISTEIITTTDTDQQRKGRVGRTKNGQYISMLNLLTDDNTDIYPPALTFTNDLSMILDWIIYLNNKKINTNYIDLYSAWPRNMINNGIYRLLSLGLINNRLEVTNFGRYIKMAKKEIYNIDIEAFIILFMSQQISPTIDSIDIIFALCLANNAMILQKLYTKGNDGIDWDKLYSIFLPGIKRSNLSNSFIDFCVIRRYLEKLIFDSENTVIKASTEKLIDLLMSSHMTKMSIIYNNALIDDSKKAELTPLNCAEYGNIVASLIYDLMPNNVITFDTNVGKFAQNFKSVIKGGNLMKNRDLEFYGVFPKTTDTIVYYKMQLDYKETIKDTGNNITAKRQIIMPMILR